MTMCYISYRAFLAVGATVGSVTHTSPTFASPSSATEDLKKK